MDFRNPYNRPTDTNDTEVFYAKRSINNLILTVWAGRLSNWRDLQNWVKNTMFVWYALILDGAKATSIRSMVLLGISSACI